ncbi:hypothetical protein M0813_28039 [Anaeramoeba flamelloides]|uniref:Uncharacterized protein n=1 Tax=Anaeramoeba flamelloides TaxID=1746091 RepID=A0AAV7ZCM0_9EUKA|nr:hypothetical protein M0812_15795 [Anaeramoeba flamelloides]KAJ6236284.1 hypothetical protein M0813_28039 [Anaeramoeba flamelloides]
MCWNLEVSITFSIIELVAIVFLWYRNYSIRDRVYSFFFLLVFFIEFSEIFLWITIPESGEFEGKCPSANVFFTSVTYFVAWMQPLGINLYCLFTTTKKQDKSKFYLSVSLASFDYVMHVISYFVRWGEVGSQQNCSVTYGKNDNLTWKWQYIKAWYYPNTYNYFVLSVIPFLFYRPWRAMINFAFPYLTTLLVTYFVFDTTVFPSTWCWTALMILIFFVLDPWTVERDTFKSCFVKKDNKKQKAITESSFSEEDQINLSSSHQDDETDPRSSHSKEESD